MRTSYFHSVAAALLRLLLKYFPSFNSHDTCDLIFISPRPWWFIKCLSITSVNIINIQIIYAGNHLSNMLS